MNQLNTSIKVLVASILVAGAIIGTAHSAGLPEAPMATRTKQVTMGDLDLSTTRGQTVAKERLLHAAERLCLSMQESTDLSHQVTYVKCVDAAMANVIPKLDALARNVTEKHQLKLAQAQK